MKGYFFSLVLLSVFVTGCGRREIIELNELEQEAAGSMVLPLALYEAQFPSARITNVAQIFGMLDLTRSHRSHPFVFQERFRRFGQQAGFANSIYEKYVVVPPGLTNSRIAGELLLINAVPFRDYDNVLSRMAITRAGHQDYRPERIAETDVREIFKQSGLEIPKPTPMPAVEAPPGYTKPSYPISIRVRMFFEDLAYYYGPGRFFWFPTMLICIGVPIIGAILLIIWFARRGR